MIVKKHCRSMLVLLPALVCAATLAKAETAQTGAPASASATVAPKAGASGATSNPNQGDAPSTTRSVFPDSPHPGIEPTQPWPHSGDTGEPK
jgi:hypothetical protein